MKGSNLTKLTRIIRDLALNPSHIHPYLTIGPWTSQSPLSLGMPWFSLSAIRFLNQYVTRTMDVFEYGSGGSTIYFSRRAAKVTSTEDNRQWLERVRTHLAADNITNANLHFHPFNFDEPVHFEQSGYLRSIPDRLFDIIIIDGTEKDVQVRPACFKFAEAYVKPGGIIIVDDSWRYPVLRSSHRGKSYREFRSIGPCRPGVTSTDIFFY